MLLHNSLSPSLSIYVVGGKILKAIFSLEEKRINVETVFSKAFYNKKEKLKLFLLGLDWLYILGIIDIDEFNNIVLLKKGN